LFGWVLEPFGPLGVFWSFGSPGRICGFQGFEVAPAFVEACLLVAASPVVFGLVGWMLGCGLGFGKVMVGCVILLGFEPEPLVLLWELDLSEFYLLEKISSVRSRRRKPGNGILRFLQDKVGFFG